MFLCGRFMVYDISICHLVHMNPHALGVLIGHMNNGKPFLNVLPDLQQELALPRNRRGRLILLKQGHSVGKLVPSHAKPGMLRYSLQIMVQLQWRSIMTHLQNPFTTHNLFLLFPNQLGKRYHCDIWCIQVLAGLLMVILLCVLFTKCHLRQS